MNDKKQSQQESQMRAGRIPQDNYLPDQGAKNDDEINLGDLWHILSKSKRLIALVVLVSVALFTIAAVTTTPVYRADVLLMPSSGGKAGKYGSLVSQFGGLADLAGISAGGGDGIETPIAILKSRKFITGFIDEYQLKPVLFGNRWDQNKGEWIVKEPSLLSKLWQSLGSEQRRVDCQGTISVEQAKTDGAS